VAELQRRRAVAQRRLTTDISRSTFQMPQRHDGTRIRAVILTTQRTGSTSLIVSLGTHPEIECAGEILNGQPDVPREAYRGPLKQAVKAWNIVRRGAWRPGHRMEGYFSGGQAKVRAFKVMYNQLRRPFAERYLVEHREVRVIHLRRHNLLKVYVSELLMPKRRHLQATGGPVEAVWIQVDPAKAVARLRRAKAEYERFDRAFERHRRLPVMYETLIDGAYLQADTARKICDFLDIGQHAMKSKITKLNPESLRDMVTNYDELASAISRTEFADMLD
jgi:hypothetical protein